MNRIIPALALCVGALLPAAANAASSLQVKDSTGVPVRVPQPVQHIGALWFAHNEVLCMLGAAPRIVATVDAPTRYPWLYRVCPAMHQAVFIDRGRFNIESLLAARTDTVFISASDGNLKALRNAGIATVGLRFTDFESMRQVVNLTASVLGADAQARASRYDAYLQARLAMVRGRTAGLADSQRPRVLHINSFEPLRVDGSDTLINDWINAAGGVNVAAEIRGNMKPVSLEQLLRWNPDIIIYAASARATMDVTRMPGWQTLAAVRRGRLVVNPEGAFLWDRYGVEEALQVQWAAKLLHPDLFRDLDMNATVRAFFSQFFDYPLSAAEATRMLDGLAPVR